MGYPIGEQGIAYLPQAVDALSILKQGFWVMVKGYSTEDDDYVGISIDDYPGESDEEILETLKTYEDYQVWLDSNDQAESVNEGLNLPKKPKPETPWEGNDRSIEISLFEYGLIVCQPIERDYPDEWIAVYKIDEDSFDSGWVQEKDLDDIILGRGWASENDINEFLHWAGQQTKEEFIQNRFIIKLADFKSYWGMDNVMGTSYNTSTKEEIIDYVNSVFPGTLDKEDILSEGLNLQKKVGFSQYYVKDPNEDDEYILTMDEVINFAKETKEINDPKEDIPIDTFDDAVDYLFLFHYNIDVDGTVYQFQINTTDKSDAENVYFKPEEKAITFMRWIRKAINNNELIQLTP